MGLVGASWAASTRTSDPLVPPGRLGVAAVGGDLSDPVQGWFGAQEVRRAGHAHELGAVVDELGEVVEVQLAGVVVEPGDPALHPPAQPGQDLVGQGVPGHVVGVVLHQGGDHVVAVAELGEQRVHDRVDRLGGVLVGRDAPPAGCVDPGRDGVEGLLEGGRDLPRRGRLAPVDALVPRREGAVEVDQLARGLGGGGVVGDHPAGAGEVEVAADPLHVVPRDSTPLLRRPPRPPQPGRGHPARQQLLAHVPVVTHRPPPPPTSLSPVCSGPAPTGPGCDAGIWGSSSPVRPRRGSIQSNGGPAPPTSRRLRAA